MNVDLVMSDNEAGLISDKLPQKPMVGLLFDLETRMMTLEIKDDDSIHFNIPVHDDFVATLEARPYLHFGFMKDEEMLEALQIPLAILSPAYSFRDSLMGMSVQRTQRSVMQITNFLRNVKSGQPINRENIGDESGLKPVSAGLNPAILKYAPFLKQQMSMEKSQEVKPVQPKPTRSYDV